MELAMPEGQLKKIIKTALVEVLTERQDLFIEIFREVLEDYALGQAIQEGIENKPVSRDEVFNVFSQNR